MTNQVAVCTIVSKNYLPFARCLMGCLRRWHPEFIRIVILADKIEGYFEPDREDFEVLPSESLPIPDSKWFHFKYSILELNTAVKPYALEVIFDRYKVDKILYFDPDIWVYQPLTPLLGTLDGASIVLTPHLTASLEDELLPNEFQVMQSGTYNLGFIAIAAGMTSFRFLRWWQGKVYNDCQADTARGLFVDQRWVDLVPGLFPEVLINREPGYNVAYWNLAHRKIERSGLGYKVNGCPLYFFHFSGFDPEKSNEFSKHQNRYRLSDLGEAKRLVEDYRLELFRHGYAACKSWPYAFATFQNGVSIPDVARRREQQSPEMLWGARDPFSVKGFQAFVHHWNGCIADSAGRSTYITRLAYQYYLRRADVQAAMPDIVGRDQQRFLEWWLTSGQKESAFHPVFIAPIRAAVQKLRSEAIEVKLQRLEALLAII